MGSLFDAQGINHLPSFAYFWIGYCVFQRAWCSFIDGMGKQPLLQLRYALDVKPRALTDYNS